MNEVVALIPARSGSKSILRKNMQSLLGRPLIAHSIEIALQSKSITKVVVSTDDGDLADISRHYGAEVPFLRPTQLALDHVKDGPVIQHLMDWIEANCSYTPRVIVFLRPTNPKRNVSFIDECVTKFINDNKSCMARSVKPSKETPYKMWSVTSEGDLVPIIGTIDDDLFNNPRQLLPKTYWQDGYIDIFNPCYFLKSCETHAVKMSAIYSPLEESVDIDYREDLIEMDLSESSRIIDQVDSERYGS